MSRPASASVEGRLSLPAKSADIVNERTDRACAQRAVERDREVRCNTRSDNHLSDERISNDYPGMATKNTESLELDRGDVGPISGGLG